MVTNNATNYFKDRRRILSRLSTVMNRGTLKGKQAYFLFFDFTSKLMV